MIRLDVGCGIEETTKEGFIGVDAYTPNAQIKANMWDLPFEDGEVDEIFSSNALEHVSKHQVTPTLQEWKRVLKIGGKLTLEVPDLEWACMWFVTHQSTSWDMDIIYGTQLHEGEYHKTGFTAKIIFDYIYSVGGFYIDSIEWKGGKSELVFKSDIGVTEEVGQKIMIVLATRVDDAETHTLINEREENLSRVTL